MLVEWIALNIIPPIEKPSFPWAALKHGIRNPESGNGITETETETETESIIIQEAVKSIPQYYTLNRLIRYIYYSTRGVQNCGPHLITRIRDIPTCFFSRALSKVLRNLSDGFT